jgi:phenylacetate-coenzyme A ligase PaaK-like adenylate-forming protein
MNLIKKFLDKDNVFDSKNEKHQTLFLSSLKKLTLHHKKNCKKYKNFMNFTPELSKIKKISDLPYLPVKIFKSNILKSISDANVFKILSSSGTTNKNKSNIFLDKANSENQIRTLNKILSYKFGKERLPMLVIDRDPAKTNRLKFSASTAAIYGFSLIASKKFYLLDDKYNIDYKVFENFIKEFSNKKFFIFGFTSFIYQYFYKKINNSKYNLKNGFLIHGGGWKKLNNLKISNNTFKKILQNKFQLKKVFNYYGLVEQTGSIFFECKNGYFVSSIFSDIIIRGKNFEPLPNGKKGLVQLISILPSSYPGHNILTEDIGSIIDKKIKCSCGLNGKHFLVHGRAKESEIRGCSDAR